MDDSTIQGEANSWSVSKSSISDPDLKTRDSGSSTSSSKSTHGQDESTTPTGQPRHSGQQSSAMPAMAPPPKPNFKATPTSAQPSQPANSADPELPFVSAEPNRNGGRQPATSSKHLAKETVQATPRKRSHVEVDRQQAADDDDSTDEDNEPAVSIAAFDWMELESRYHQQMDQYRAQEQDLYRSFDELIQVRCILLSLFQSD